MLPPEKCIYSYMFNNQWRLQALTTTEGRSIILYVQHYFDNSRHVTKVFFLQVNNNSQMKTPLRIHKIDSQKSFWRAQYYHNSVFFSMHHQHQLGCKLLLEVMARIQGVSSEWYKAEPLNWKWDPGGIMSSATNKTPTRDVLYLNVSSSVLNLQ